MAPINDDGELLLDEFEKLLTPRTRLVAVVHVSNSLGTVNPVKRIVELAHARGVPVLVDGAQSAPHLPVNVRAGLRLLHVVDDRDREMVAGAGPARVGGSGTGRFRAGGGVGARHRVGQVEQRAAQLRSRRPARPAGRPPGDRRPPPVSARRSCGRPRGW